MSSIHNFEIVDKSLIGYTGTSTIVLIPNGVEEIGSQKWDVSKPFQNNNVIVRVRIPEGVTVIHSYAFAGCQNLEKVYLPSTLKVIEYNAFAGCIKLQNIHFPEGLEKIESSSFYDCKSLTELVMPEKLKEVGTSAFAQCENIKTLSVGEKTTLMSGCFKGCKGLVDENGFIMMHHVLYDYCGDATELTIPKHINKISENVLFGKEHIKKIIISEGVEHIDDSAFYFIPNLEEVILPSTLKTIGKNAFSNCKKLTQIHLPDSVTTIGDGAFSHCEELTSCILPINLKELPNTLFRSCVKLEMVNIPDSVKKIGTETFGWCKSLKDIKLPETLESIGSSAFTACKSMQSIVLPESLNHISQYKSWSWSGDAFEEDTFVIAKKMFESMKQIKDSCYWNGFYILCSITDTNGQLLQKVMVQKDFEVLFDKTGIFDFKQYDMILINNGPKIKIPAIVRNLAMVYRLRYPVDLTEQAKASMLELVGKNIKKIAPYLNILAEDGLVSMLEDFGLIHAKNKKTLLPLMGIAVAEEVKPKKAKKTKFEATTGEKTPAQWKKEWNFKKLEDGTLCLTSYKGMDTELVIPEKIGEEIVSTLGKECLSCSDYIKINDAQKQHRKTIRSVVIPEGVTVISESAFYCCESLETVILPKSLQKIEQFAFCGCAKLKNLQIQNANVTIEKCVFRRCNGLADEAGFICVNGLLYDYIGNDSELVIPDGVKEITDSSCYQHKNITQITIPDSVEVIHDSAFDKYYALRLHKTVIVGMTNSEAEEYATRNKFNFKSIGVSEKKKKELEVFLIKDGELLAYYGDEEVVTIPKGVTKLSTYKDPRTGRTQGVFYSNRTIKKVIIPDGVKEIVDRTFYYCVNLTEIEFPDTIEYINKNAFDLTPWLRNQKETLYIGKVLVKCNDQCEEYHVKPGTLRIGDYAFSDNVNVKKIVIPEGVTSIGDYAFGNGRLEELVIPSTVTTIGESVLGYYHEDVKVSGTVLHQTTKLPASFKAFYCGAPEDTAWIVLYQPDKAWQNMIYNSMEKNPDHIIPTLEHLAKLLPEAIENKTVGNRVVAFLQIVCAFADAQTLKPIYQMLVDAKHTAVKKLEENAFFMQKLNDEKEDVSNLHPTERYVVEHLKVTSVYKSVLSKIPEGVRYANSEEVCAPRVVAFVISEYVKKHDPESCKYVSEYEYACTPYSWSKEADEVMKSLDYNQMMDLMKKLAELNTEAYWLPYARYTDEKRTVELISQMKEWSKWYVYDANGRKNIIVSRCGLLLNDTKAAMIYLDKSSGLHTYASMRNTDAETLRDTVLSEFGFNEQREKIFDLGQNTLIVRIADDLSLCLYDGNTKKNVKSVPKKNATPELYEKVKSELSDLKKNIKKVVTNRRHALFAKFLSGSSQDAQSWKRTYLDNPVLYSVARLLVWTQDNTSFVLEDDGLKDCNGNEYTLTNEEIYLAHPMELSKETVDAWRTYFTQRGLKQPFEQIWEPAYPLSDIKADRYKGSELNVYRMNNKENHGIRMWGLTAYSEDYGFNLDDCDLQYEASEWRFIPGITDDVVFKLGNFKIEKHTRKANHIVYLLDKWTITERLLKDDVSIEEMLVGFTIAQITELIQLANENNCNNCKAMLLDFKNKNFEEIDPFAEFTLDF